MNTHPILQAVEELKQRAADLAKQLEAAALLIRAAGILPGDELIDALTSVRREFDQIETQLRGAAAAYGQHLPEPSVSSLSSLEEFAREILVNGPGCALRSKALAVLDQILALQHVEHADFPPLKECQREALSLRNAIAAMTPPQMHPSVAPLADGSHPLAQLLWFVENLKDLDDLTWQQLFQVLLETVGAPLAVAASRGKLLVGEAAAEPPETSETEDFSRPDHRPLIPTPGVTAEEQVTQQPLAVEPESDGKEIPESGRQPEPVPPPEPVQANGRLVFDHASPAHVVARAVQATGRPWREHASELTELIWRLVREGHPGLAYHLARAMEAEPGLAGSTLPSWLLRAVILGPQIRHVTGGIEQALRQDFSNFSPQCFVPGNAEWNHAVRFLLAAAALQPALLAPTTGATVVLRELRVKEGLGTLYQYFQDIAEFGDRLQGLDLHTLRGLKDETAWQVQMDTLREDVKSWYDGARATTILYAPATNVWLRWLEPGGLVGRLLLPVRQDRVDRIGEVEAEVKRLTDTAEVRREINSTDRELRRKRAAEQITARALVQIQEHLSRAVDFARRWIQLHRARPGGADGYFYHKADELRRRVWESHASVRRELEEFRHNHPSACIDAATDCCLRAIESLHALFDPDSPLPTEEPDLRSLLNGDLLRLIPLQLNDNWEPEAEDLPRVAEAIIDLVARGDWGWEEVLAARTHQRDHAATLAILQYLQMHPSDNLDLDQLWRQRERQVQECRDALRRDIIDTQARVESAVAYGLLREDERADMASRIQGIEVSLPRTLRFHIDHAELEKIRQRIEEKRQVEVETVRQRLNAAQVDSAHPAYARVIAALGKGDVLTANEYLDMLRSGEDLPEETEEGGAFEDFWSKAREIDEKLGNLMPQAVVKRVREQGTVAGVNLSRVPGKQAEQAADMMEAWFTAKNAQKITEPVARRILSHLGFHPLKIQVQPSGRRTWIEVTAEPIGDKNRCPVPQYGSEAKGFYRILCVWDRPSEEDLLNDIGPTSHGAPVLVWHFGRMSVQRRRDLARLCRERRRTCIVLDDVLLLYLCGVRGSRLPVMFECALPFTFLEPYVTTASLVPPEVFYGRERERDSIISPFGSCFIYGGRQLGKTALLREVERSFHDPNEGKIALWIDLKAEGIGYNRPIDDIWTLLAGELKKVGVLPSHLPSHANVDKVIDQTVEWLERGPQRRILVLLDEADRFLESDGREEFQRSARLKGWMERTNRRFKAVFAGLHNVLRTTRQQNHPLAHYGEPLCIGPLLANGDWRHARALIERPLNALGYRLSPDLITRILSQTNYYPSLIQLYCNQLLRHVTKPDVVTFDPRTSPPYEITSRHVEEAYLSQQLRDAIRDRFMLTLQLDPRYEVIAYAIAYKSLTQQNSNMAEGFSVSSVRWEALRWWPEGFKDGAPEDAFRVLLDEMVGLGVLREAGEGRYALRSPNVVLLMGTPEEIKSRLERNREAPLDYEPHTFRSAYRVNGTIDPSRRSPLTAQQESELRSRRNGVSIVLGCPAAGLNELQAYLLSAFGDEYYIAASHIMDRQGFSRQLADLSRREQDGVSILFVPPTCPWSEEWVDEAVQRLSRLKSKSSFVRVVLAADPRSAWRLIAQFPDGFDALSRKGVTILSLRPWHDNAVRQWMQDNGLVPQDQAARDRIYQVTGHWPYFLQQLYELSRREANGSWERALEHLDASLHDPAVRREWSQQLALDRPEVRRILDLLTGGEASAAELVEVLEDVPSDVVRRTLAWAEWLGLTRPSGPATWVVEDPVVRRLLRAAGE